MDNKSVFELFLFFKGINYIKPAMESRIDGIIVDLEHIGKESRQACADTEINYNDFGDLLNVRVNCASKVICRINRFGGYTPVEIEKAIEIRADELLLPMARSAREVEAVLKQASGRCGVGILIETKEALEIAEDLARLPLCRVYVGFNDLAIDRNTPNIFTPIIDGTLERLRNIFRDFSFGFAGLTLPDKGFPIPCNLLIGEMARLNCSFTFLRRSFYRDTEGKDMPIEVGKILDALDKASKRSLPEIRKQRKALEEAVRSYPNNKTILNR